MKNNDKYNYNLKNIGNWRKEFNKEILEKTREAQQKYNFDMGPNNNSTHNNEADAVKHALMQAILIYRSGGLDIPARFLGNYHELEGDWSKQPIQEKNMDLWNNQIGRGLALEVLKDLKSKHLGKPKNQKEFEDEFLKKLYKKLQNGELITKPFEDKRSYKDLQKSQITGQASNLKYSNHIYTREEIGKMSTDDYAKHEPAILKQMKEKGIPTKKELEQSQRKSTNKTSNTSNSNRHWVTINGNHILIDK